MSPFPETRSIESVYCLEVWDERAKQAQNRALREMVSRLSFLATCTVLCRRRHRRRSSVVDKHGQLMLTSQSGFLLCSSVFSKQPVLCVFLCFTGPTNSRVQVKLLIGNRAKTHNLFDRCGVSPSGSFCSRVLISRSFKAVHGDQYPLVTKSTQNIRALTTKIVKAAQQDQHTSILAAAKQASSAVASASADQPPPAPAAAAKGGAGKKGGSVSAPAAEPVAAAGAGGVEESKVNGPTGGSGQGGGNKSSKKKTKGSAR